MRPRSKRIARPGPPPFPQLRTDFPPSPFSQPRFRGPPELSEASLSPGAYRKRTDTQALLQINSSGRLPVEAGIQPRRSCCPHWSDAGSGRSLLSPSLSEGKPAQEGPALTQLSQGQCRDGTSLPHGDRTWIVPVPHGTVQT